MITLNFLTESISPRTLSFPDCPAEGISPASLVPRAELKSNVCPTVTAEPPRLNAELQCLLMLGQVMREVVLLSYKREKKLCFCASLSILNRTPDPNIVLLNKWGI